MSKNQTADIVIIGGGVIGCSIAYYLSLAGAQVIVLERETIAAEASSAAAGLLTPLGNISGPGAYTDLLLASWSLSWELLPQLEQTSGIQTDYYQPGSLLIAADEKEGTHLRELAAVWQALGAEVTWLPGNTTREREPLLKSPLEGAVYVPQGGSIKPAAVTRAFAEAARRQGAIFLEQTGVIAIQHNASRVAEVQTATGETIAGNHLVIATGAWSAQCGNWLGFPLPVYPMRGQILSLRQPVPPLQHILFGEDIYLVPKPDHTIYVGATREQADFEKSVTAAGISWLLTSAIRLVPALANASIVDIWAGLRPWSPDSRPILGKAPGWENVTLATGHGATGFELSAITGKTIAELIITGQTPDIIRAFGIERFSNAS